MCGIINNMLEHTPADPRIVEHFDNPLTIVKQPPCPIFASFNLAPEARGRALREVMTDDVLSPLAAKGSTNP